MRLSRKTRWGASILAVAAIVASWLYFRETKIAQISAVCLPDAPASEAVHWVYSTKVDPTVIKEVSPALAVTLHYTGSRPRAVPPMTTYFYRQSGATLRIASSAATTIPPKGTFTYNIDTGGYVFPLIATGHDEPQMLRLSIEVDGKYFGLLMSPQACLHALDRHLDIAETVHVPDLKDKHPVNVGAYEYYDISELPPAVEREEGKQVSTYAFFRAPIALTETKNETSVPDDVAKQLQEVGVTAATPLFSLSGEAAATAGNTPSTSKGG